MSTTIRILERELVIHGGFTKIAQLAGDGYEFADRPMDLVEQLTRQRIDADIFTFMQRVNEPEQKYPYPMEYDNYAAQEIGNFDEWWNKKIGFKARNKAKQAEKRGVILREVPFGDELVEGIARIYNESPIRQGRRFPHYGKGLSQVHKEEATFLDRSTFIGAYYEDELIGFVKLVADETNTQAGLMNIVSLLAHRDKAPTNALVAQAARVCGCLGIRYLVYSQFAYGRKSQSSLSDFKERMGFVRIDVPRYYVPLNYKGKIALQAGLMRPWKEYIPEALAERLRELRSRWYTYSFGHGDLA